MLYTTIFGSYLDAYVLMSSQQEAFGLSIGDWPYESNVGFCRI